MQKVSFEEVYGNQYIQESIRTVVEQVTKINPAMTLYADDMEQELWIHINRALSKFTRDGEASIESFFRGVIDRRIANVIRRILSRMEPIQFPKEELDSEEARQIAGRNNLRLLMLKMDLDTVLNTLSPEQKQVCDWIMAGESLADIARRLGLAESKFFYRYIYPLRQKFKSENLDNYLI